MLNAIQSTSLAYSSTSASPKPAKKQQNVLKAIVAGGLAGAMGAFISYPTECVYQHVTRGVVNICVLIP
jgi:hypothetical protein